jgi:2-(3-amino-3-carboxypropyl)histidine synthase
MNPLSEKERAAMRLHFIPVRYKKKVELPQELIKKLPKRVILFTTIQYHNQLNEWKKTLEAAGKQVHTFKPKHSVAEGHLLGCGIEQWDVDADCFLFVGDGLFHPKALVIKNDLPVWCFDPKRAEYFQMKDEDIRRAKQRQKAALARFYSAKKVGVLVTTKHGQQRIALSLKLKEKFPDKEFFYFLFDSIDFSSLEDFAFIECFVNTMCPRLGLDDTNRSEKLILDVGELGFAW